MPNSSTLIPIEDINPSEVFAGEQLDVLLKQIRSEAISDDIDLETVVGRKAIGARAYAVSRSKTTIDDAGKTLVAGWKAKAKVVDTARRKSREFLDALRDEVRKPLDDWETKQERIKQEEVDKELAKLAEAEAARQADIERKENDLREREEALLKAEQEAAAKAEAEKAEIERAANEAAIKEQAKRDAEKNAADAIEREREAKLDAETAAKLAAKQAEKDQKEAVELAEKRVRDENERAAREQEALKAAERAEQARLADNLEHRRTVNVAAMKALETEGIEEDIAKKAISAIATGLIPCVKIDYTKQENDQ
ncbi:MAG: hypothetical protein COB36_11460 [Alphaproteobacteria bacterium]|nr:MAG: hypothetical protein COB36_11460 [Alphaproteobacteria bacterium]